MKSSPIFVFLFLVLTQYGLAKQPCCKQPCIDIMPCPVSEPVKMPVCDPSIHIYEVNGTLDYWTELMVPQAKPCEYRWDDFGFFWPSDDAGTSVHSQQGGHQQGPHPQTQQGKHITLRPMRVDAISGTQFIAHQRNVDRRRAHAEGCFASPDLFLVEGIWFDR